MPETTRIVIADDHPLIRAGLRQVIESEADMSVVGEAGDGESALELLRIHRPALAILDLEMPKLTGLNVARCCITENIPTRVIILTMYDDEVLYNEAIEIGVLGYVLKDSASLDIIKAIRAVQRGEFFVSPAMSNYSIRSRRSKITASEQILGLHALSPSERRILKLVAEEKTSVEIAESLSISQRTVDNHRTNICHKLGLNGVNSLLRFALTHRGEL